MGRAKQEFIASHLSYSVNALKTYAADVAARPTFLGYSDAITTAVISRNKLIIAENSGSATDAKHIAGKFVPWLFDDRAPVSAVALSTDDTVLTAVGNDSWYDKVFERQVLGSGTPGDVVLGNSTSGKSPNILLALNAAKAQGAKMLGFTGAHVTAMNGNCDMVLAALSSMTSIVQQIHIVVAHMIYELVKKHFVFSAPKAEPQ